MVNLGYALLRQSSEIVICGLIKQTSDAAVDYHCRGLWMGQHVHFALGTLLEDEDLISLLDVIIEVPANWFNQRGQQSKDNEAIQKLYFTVGCIIALLACHPYVNSVWCITPIWKGSLPKDVMVERAKRFALAQDRTLKDHVPHDTAEALLLARWALDRYEPLTGEFATPLVRLYRKGYLGSSQFSQEEFIDYVNPTPA